MSNNHADNPEPILDDNRLRIKYEVPLPWLLGVLFVIVAQAATVYFAQVRQGEMIAAQSDAIKDLVLQVRALGVQLGSANSKDIEHDYRLQDHERRLSNLENTARAKS